jgi:alkylated DNA repair dioxygenase AlkB
MKHSGIDLFSDLPENTDPPGFVYQPDFINAAEEAKLCRLVSHLHLQPFKFHGFEAKRKTASFGYDYHFDNRSLTKGEPIPHEFLFLVDKVARYLALPPADFSKLLATEYPPGSVINWHRDAPPFELIAGISLLTDCTFRLRPHDKSRQGRAAIRTYTVARRSLYIMRGAAREDWQHSITPVKETRYSITLRTLKHVK